MDRAVAALAPLIEPGRVLLIGEVHGTNEYPALVGSIAAAAVAQRCPVTVALELPASEQPRIDAFLDSDGTPAARAALTAGPFWNAPMAFADGRSSRAMVALMDRLRELRTTSTGTLVRVVALDDPLVEVNYQAIPFAPVGDLVVTPEQQSDFAGQRDLVMAERLIGAVEGFTVALLGNVHVSVRRDGPGGHVPVGWHVAERVPSTVSLLGTCDGGTFWAITDPDAGGAEQVMSDRKATLIGASWGDRPDHRGYHGTVHVGPITASPPVFMPA